MRDKHIRDMVCPVCWEPDINDPEHLNSYFSTLDIQVGKQMKRGRNEGVRVTIHSFYWNSLVLVQNECDRDVYIDLDSL